MRQDAFNELGSLFHVLDLGSKLEEKVVLESLVLDIGKEQMEALDFVVQHKQTAQIRVDRVLPALPLVHTRNQLKLVAYLAEERDLHFTAAGDFIRERFEIVQSCLVEPVLFLGVNFLLEAFQLFLEAILLNRETF